MSERYQGWANYETWNVVLWLGNKEAAYKVAMNQIVFNVTLQLTKKAQSYATAVESAAHRAFGTETPDGVRLTSAKSKVDWEDAARFFADDIEQLESEWVEIASKLTPGEIMVAKEKFRADHRY